MSASKEEVLEDIKKAADKVDGYLSEYKYSEAGKYDRGVAERRFGSWSKAKEAAGLPVRQKRRVPRGDLLEDLQRVSEIVGKSPTVKEYKDHGDHSIGAFRSRFGSWNTAKGEAGLEKYVKKEPRESNTDKIEDMRKAILYYIAKKMPVSKTEVKRSLRGNDHFILEEFRFLISEDLIKCANSRGQYILTLDGFRVFEDVRLNSDKDFIKYLKDFDIGGEDQDGGS